MSFVWFYSQSGCLVVFSAIVESGHRFIGTSKSYVASALFVDPIVLEGFGLRRLRTLTLFILNVRLYDFLQRSIWDNRWIILFWNERGQNFVVFFCWKSKFVLLPNHLLSNVVEHCTNYFSILRLLHTHLNIVDFVFGGCFKSARLIFKRFEQ